MTTPDHGDDHDDDRDDDRDDVVATLDVVRALPAPSPSVTQHRRRRAALDDALAADEHARRRPRLSRLGSVVAACAVLVVAGPALAALIVTLATTPSPPPPPPPTTTTPSSPAVEAVPIVPVVPLAPVVDTIVAAPPATPAPAPTTTTTTRRRRPAPRVDEVAVAVAALRDADDRAAATTLSTSARDDFARVDTAIDAAIDAAIASSDDEARARLRRVRCELHLRYRRDVGALEVCRAFSQHHPADLAVRPLAFGAGGLAEQLGRFDDAIDLYTRCIVVAPLHGQSSADALKARARVHAAAGHVDDAAADLRLFLRLRPAAGFDDDVRALARRLDVR